MCRWRRVSLMFGKTVLRIEPVELDKKRVPVHFGHDRGRRNACALGVALDHRLLRAGERADADRVGEQVVDCASGAAIARSIAKTDAQ